MSTMYTAPLSVLSGLGLSDQEGRVYLALLELGPSSVMTIAEHAGIKRTSIYNFIDRLVELGIIHQKVAGKKKVYEAVDPQELIALEEKRLQILKSGLGTLASLANGRPNKPRLTYFQGQEQVKQLLFTVTQCKKECQVIWPSEHALPMVGGIEHANYVNELRIQAGIFVRTIHFLDKETGAPSLLESQIPSANQLSEIRYALGTNVFPMAILMYDVGKVGFISSRSESFGFLIESQELYTSMLFLFELFWKNSLVKPGA